ncbi:hypothetical protein EVAR_56255_1 [Eumeta japonica]|uniref:Histone-lysine N-methyltransferase SETMAR n=1 Tax=Eumeta variegata TaxID=151549 RepID=A0A4C1XKE0_EUMVA|nr:hypothetical protein EVAR_56255_1 [Eumeta japonica]
MSPSSGGSWYHVLNVRSMQRHKRSSDLRRALFDFELLLAVKYHARPLIITGLQNSSAVVSAAVNNKNIDSERRMIEDSHVTSHEIRTSLGIGMSQIQLILHRHLGTKKLCSRWIPHKLIEAQRRNASLGAMPCLPDSRKGVKFGVGHSNR